MKKLSTGEDATLANHRDMAVRFFGKSSPAVTYLDKLIKEQGPDAEVIADESQMIYLLSHLHAPKQDD